MVGGGEGNKKPDPFNNCLVFQLCLQYGYGLLFPTVGKLQLGLV